MSKVRAFKAKEAPPEVLVINKEVLSDLQDIASKLLCARKTHDPMMPIIYSALEHYMLQLGMSPKFTVEEDK